MKLIKGIGLTLAVIASSSTMAMSKKPSQPAYKTEYLEIAGPTRTCQGVVEQQCMLYKKFDLKDGKKVYQNTEWYNFYDQIEGFKHDKTKHVALKVRVYDVANPPADGSSARYVLEKVMETKSAKKPN